MKVNSNGLLEVKTMENRQFLWHNNPTADKKIALKHFPSETVYLIAFKQLLTLSLRAKLFQYIGISYVLNV